MEEEILPWLSQEQHTATTSRLVGVPGTPVAPAGANGITSDDPEHNIREGAYLAAIWNTYEQVVKVKGRRIRIRKRRKAK